MMRAKNTVRLTIYLSLMLGFSPAIRADFDKTAYVPPGFETLLDPQTNQVDVYYGGVYLTSALATFTPTRITFNNPADITQHIPDLLAPEAFVSLISGTLANNADAVCLQDKQSGCGKIYPQTVGVIFDADQFRADLFINPSLLAVRQVTAGKFLPPSSAGFAVLSQVNAAVNGQEQEESTYNISNHTMASIGASRLQVLSHYSSQQAFTVDRLTLAHEHAGNTYAAGYFQTSGLNLAFLTEQNFAGISLASSLNTRTDLEQSTGSHLQIFLSSRSRVEIFKDNRLISTQVYDAGNQILDTSDLPNGAYDVLLQIRDAYGEVRQETRFFAKTTRLPPKDYTAYFFDLGMATQGQNTVLPAITDESILRAGASRRLTPGFGASVGISARQNRVLYEMGLFKLGRSYNLNFNVASDGQNKGVNLLTQYARGLLTLNAGFRATWTASPDGSLFGGTTRQSTVNLSYPVRGGRLAITGRYSRRPDLPEEKYYGLRYDLPSFRSGRTSLDTHLQITRDNDNLQARLALRLSFHHPNWQQALSSQYDIHLEGNAEADNGFENTLATAWRDGDKFLSDAHLNLQATDRGGNKRIEAGSQVNSNLGRFNANLIFADNSDTKQYNAGFSTNILAGPGMLSFGGRRSAPSALILNLQGEEKDTFVEVLVNDAPVGFAKVGTKTIIGLRPYNSYRVSLSSQGDDILNLDNREKRVTLYPGNVVTLDWHTTKVLVIVGQLVDANNNPIANTLLSGVAGIASTDEFGYFQAEVESSAQVISTTLQGKSCQARIPERTNQQNVVMVGKMVCPLR